MFLVHADYQALVDKGVESMLFDRDEEGFFGRVVTVHPLAARSRVLALSSTHIVHEFGYGVRLWRGRRRWLDALALPFRLPVLCVALAVIARRERVDLIRATDPYVAGPLAWWVATVTGRPFCVSIHADYQKRFALNARGGTLALGRRLGAWLRRRVLKRATRVMPIRRHLAQQVIAEGVDPARVRVIPHGIDLDLREADEVSDVRARFGIPETDALIVFAGRISRENYIDDLLAASEWLGARRSGFTVLLIGDGDEGARVRERIRHDATLRACVRSVGFQPRAVALAARRSALVNVCLMGGFSLIESCAAATPVVAYDVEWHSELVSTGETGWLLREGDTLGLAAALEAALSDPAAARELGARARTRVLGLHDITQTSHVKRQVYEEMLAEVDPQ